MPSKTLLSLKTTLRGGQSWFGRLEWSPDGTRIAAGCGDKAVYLWTPEAGSTPSQLKGHKGSVFDVSWAPDGRRLASASRDGTVRVWDVTAGYPERVLEGHQDAVRTVAWSRDGTRLVTGARDDTMRVWDASSGDQLHQITGLDSVRSVAWSPDGSFLASGGGPRTVFVWDPNTWKPVWTGAGHKAYVFCVAWSPDQRLIASCSTDKTIGIWEAVSGRQLAVLEGHTNRVGCVAFSADCRWLASKSTDGTVRIWNTQNWEPAQVLAEPPVARVFPGLAFHPSEPLLATLGERDSEVRLWTVDPSVPGKSDTAGSPEVVRHRTAKIALLGDSGVGKTTLGHRLAEGEFKKYPSTHGQQFWVIPEFGTRLEDGTQCEAVLWDFAGQPDYRLVHALFLEDVDLALIVFDPTDPRDPFHGVDYWLRALAHRNEACRCVLVAGRTDVGQPRVTQDEIDAFCRERGIAGGFVSTSALEGTGMETLAAMIHSQLDWQRVVSTTTTGVFKRIKDQVMAIKEDAGGQGVLLTPKRLRELLGENETETGLENEFSDDELLTAVEHLAKHGYVSLLRSFDERRTILLVPELLNNLAASFIVEARRNPKGLGALEERRVLEGRYPFPELEGLGDGEPQVLLESAVALFMRSNVCFRETLGEDSFLVFPELINVKEPRDNDESEFIDDYSYTAQGAIENVYSSLVVLMGYTNVIRRAHQWRNHARYQIEEGEFCGFRQVREREGEIDFQLYASESAKPESRQTFRSLFEQFLSRHPVTVTKYPVLICPDGHHQERSTVIRRVRQQKDFLHCDECGERVSIANVVSGPSIVVGDHRDTRKHAAEATRRTRFETCLVMINAYRSDQKSPVCFISYAWGIPEHERWVERRLALDLRKAGIRIILDRWHGIGGSLGRFVGQIDQADNIVVVGTPLYREKYENKVSDTGSVVAAEVDLINNRLLGTEEHKETVIPVLLDGEPRSSLPPLMQARFHVNFKEPDAYFTGLFDLILHLYRIPFESPAVAELRDALTLEAIGDA